MTHKKKSKKTAPVVKTENVNIPLIDDKDMWWLF